jgi:anthranilate phosphoribosyltransferase
MHPSMQGILKEMMKNPSNTTAETAKLAMTELLEGRATPAQIAAYLIGLKLDSKEHDPKIIAASADVMRSHALAVHLSKEMQDDVIDIVGTGGDGHNTFNVSTASSIIAAGAGCVVAKHGNRASSSSSGSADVLEALGCRLDNVVPEQVQDLLTKCRFVFLFAQTYHPAMKNVAGPRREMGVPTIFNLLGPLSNPTMPKCMVVGVHSLFLGPLMAEALQLLGVERGMVVCGNEGLDEVCITVILG